MLRLVKVCRQRCTSRYPPLSLSPIVCVAIYAKRLPGLVNGCCALAACNREGAPAGQLWLGKLQWGRTEQSPAIGSASVEESPAATHGETMCQISGQARSHWPWESRPVPKAHMVHSNVVGLHSVQFPPPLHCTNGVRVWAGSCVKTDGRWYRCLLHGRAHRARL